jgi:hypothetical protein
VSKTAWHFIRGGVVFGHPRSDVGGVYVNQIVPVRPAKLWETILWLVLKREPRP